MTANSTTLRAGPFISNIHTMEKKDPKENLKLKRASSNVDKMKIQTTSCEAENSKIPTSAAETAQHEIISFEISLSTIRLMKDIEQCTS
ncbi:hypothetical protein TSUD_67730 [Trifolium subterraneum]|uniref:Uncharacterized protein n=1 Tax=Trifolium subterraneum TaxID=3900 RepID=A0A2Z6MEC9_TRISU|nr:hypothetical protein TSUD_67730 [Trifolium subterraneum]